MDTKKRPNQDLLDYEADPSPAITQPDSTSTTDAPAANPQTGGDSPSVMDIDSTTSKPAAFPEAVQPSPATHSSAIMATDNTQLLSSEANKRVKLTMETNHTGSNLTSSIDLADPSQESKEPAEWVSKMAKDDHPKGNRSNMILTDRFLSSMDALLLGSITTPPLTSVY
jgi:hypothetical protein